MRNEIIPMALTIVLFSCNNVSNENFKEIEKIYVNEPFEIVTCKTDNRPFNTIFGWGFNINNGQNKEKFNLCGGQMSAEYCSVNCAIIHSEQSNNK